MTKELNYLKNTEKQVRLIESLIKAKKYANRRKMGQNEGRKTN